MSYPLEFELLRKFLGSIPNINWGGCGIAALAMYRMGKKLDMNVHIMYLYQEKEKFEGNCLALVFDEEKGNNCNHAVCVVDNTALDAHKEVFLLYYDYKHFLPEDVVIRTLKSTGWNTDFNRAKYLPIIENYIGEALM